jgi:serine/threonine-protein kinase
MSDSLPVSVQLRLEEACARFEAAWQAAGPDGLPPPLEDHLAGVAGPTRQALLWELLLLELHYRRRRGERPGPADYAARFPGGADLIRGALAATDPGASPPQTLPGQGAAGGEGYLTIPGYEVRGALGQGGMGVVVRGHDLHLGRDLAVKVLREKYRGEPRLVQRFLAEARIHGRLQHPGIVPLHELGELPDRRPYFTMKLVEGRTLAELLKERADSAHDLPRFVGIFEQVCQAVAYAHSKGVIHRDLKPANVMVGAFGEVQVMDWGLAKVLTGREPRPAGETLVGARNGPSAVGSTVDGGGVTGVVGTPAYMPPEQARGESATADERADVFGLGAMLCEILTGRPPFAGADPGAVLARAQVGDHAAALAALEASGADAELVRLAKGCLAAEPSGRPADAGAVAAAMTAYLAGVQERLRRAELERAAAEVRAREERKRRRVSLALAAAVLLLVSGGTAAGLLWQLRQRQVDAGANQAMGEARRRLEEARAAPVFEVRRFREARDASRQAEELARRGNASEDVRRRATDLAAELEQEAGAAERDQRLLAALLEVRGPREGPTYQKNDKGLMIALSEPSADEQFAAAFREWDPSFDVDALPTAVAAARLKGRPSAVVIEVITALDQWAGERQRDRSGQRKDPAEWQRRWQRVADLAVALDDSGSERRGLRDILGRGRLEWERGLGALAMALRPVPVPFDTVGEDRGHLRRLAAALDVTREPVLGLLTLVRALRAAGDDALAEKVLRKGLLARPQEVALHVALGRVLEEQPSPRWDEVVGCFATARALRPDLGEPLAFALVHSGRVEDGLTLYEWLVRERPENPWLRFRYGNAMYSQGRYPQAEEAYREALRLKPDYPGALNNLGNALWKQRQYKTAQAEYRAAIRSNPDFPLAHYNLANALRAQGLNPKEVEAEYRKAIDLKPDYPEAHTNLGNALSDQRRYEEAEVEHRIALALRPDFPEAHKAHFNLGNALRDQARYPEAAAEFRAAIKLKPDYANAYCNLGAVLSDWRRPDEAERALRAAVRLQPEDPMLHLNLAVTLRDQGKFSDALASVRRCHELGTGTPGWRHPSAKWVRQIELQVELDGRLPALLRGEDEPAGAAECLDFAYCAHYKRLHTTAYWLFVGAFTADPKLADDLRTLHRYNAARTAALAAAGRGEGADPLPDKAVVMLRRQALEWLRADVALWAKVAERDEAPAKQAVRQTMQHWRQDTDLASVRDQAALDGLPDDERRPWRQLWDDVDALLARVNPVP